MSCNIVTILTTLFILVVILDAKPTSRSKNHELLSKLGFTKVRAPNSHHRKRLAVESRHHSRSDDSHMFIIKLPPNPHYYGHNHPNNIEIPPAKNVPIGFKSNGKPEKIYHWNIPVIKKFATAQLKSRVNGYNEVDFQNPESWNEVLDKPDGRDKKIPLKPSYYVPAKPTKSSFMKYFPGNGKPHSFYVIEKSKKAHYHRLLP